MTSGVAKSFSLLPAQQGHFIIEYTLSQQERLYSVTLPRDGHLHITKLSQQEVRPV